jgi:hypothetical protein
MEVGESVNLNLQKGIKNVAYFCLYINLTLYLLIKS